jgi:hypothetical protein
LLKRHRALARMSNYELESDGPLHRPPDLGLSDGPRLNSNLLACDRSQNAFSQERGLGARLLVLTVGPAGPAGRSDIGRRVVVLGESVKSRPRSHQAVAMRVPDSIGA